MSGDRGGVLCEKSVFLGYFSPISMIQKNNRYDIYEFH